MNDVDVKSLIVVEQLPQIKATLEELSKEIQEEVKTKLSLVCNEDTVKDIKKVRADLKKQFEELENQRKFVKSAIMAKYDEFEEIYKEKIANIYKNSDAELKQKIDAVEDELKLQKENEIREFANQYIELEHLQDVITYESIGIVVTLSASIKSLKEQVLSFVEKVTTDLKLIDLEEFKDEILIEYKNNGLDLAKAKLDVVSRHKQLEELKQKEAMAIEVHEEEQQVVQTIVEELHAPVYEKDEEEITCQFTVTATKDKIKELKQFLIERGYKYE